MTKEESLRLEKILKKIDKADETIMKGETDRMKIAVAIIFLVAAVFGLLGTD